MATKQYTVGESSRRFLDALDAFQVFETKFYDALTDEYGEKQGDELYQQDREKFDAAERVIMEYLRILFTQSMGTGADHIEI